MNDDKPQMVVKCDKNKEPAAKTAPAKPTPEAAAKKKEPLTDKDSSDEEEKPAAKAAPAKPVTKVTDEKDESSSEDSSNEDVAVGKVSKAPKPYPEKYAAKPAATAAKT
jgi:nucleolin